MALSLDEDGLVPPLEQVSAPSVAIVEGLGVDAIQLAHAERDISVGRLDEQMVFHQTVGMAYPVVTTIYSTENAEEGLPVLAIPENGLFFIPPGGNVVKGARVFDAKRTSHDRTEADRNGN
jgi:hypothetical protein